MVYIRKSFQGILNFGATKEVFEMARELRKNQTRAEQILWEDLRSRRCAGLIFRRQHPVNIFILDFYCHEYLLGIEIDGSVHDKEEAKEYDLNRTAELEDLGITLLRFKNEDVLDNRTKVLTDIQKQAERLQEAKKQRVTNSELTVSKAKT